MSLLEYIVRASAKELKTVPWGSMERDAIWDYVDAEFLPPDIVIRDPSRMVAETLNAIMKFWSARKKEGKEVF